MTARAHLAALLVDDERLARAELRTLLSAHPEVEVVGEASDVEEAAARAADLRPDVVFLDIRMPGADGFSLLPRLPASARVVFVTAFSEHAVRAFEVNALDYLLKPVPPGRLAATVRRLLSGAPAPPPPRRALRRDDPLIFPSGDHSQVVRVGQIACIAAARDDSEVVTADGRRTLVSRSLKEWEETLPSATFLRVHRSTLVPDPPAEAPRAARGEPPLRGAPQGTAGLSRSISPARYSATRAAPAAFGCPSSGMTKEPNEPPGKSER
jgi:two-component system LytT family response regulator